MNKTAICFQVSVWFITIFIACGCGNSSKSDVAASDKQMQGNLLAFLNEQVIKNGGTLGTSNDSINEVNCSWRFRTDANGTQIFTDAKFFHEVDQFFLAALHSPNTKYESEPGRYYVRYNIEKAGVLIQYSIARSPFKNIPDPMLHVIILNQRGFSNL